MFNEAAKENEQIIRGGGGGGGVDDDDDDEEYESYLAQIPRHEKPLRYDPAFTGPESFPRRVRDQHGLYLVLVLVFVSVYVGGDRLSLHTTITRLTSSVFYRSPPMKSAHSTRFPSVKAF